MNNIILPTSSKESSINEESHINLETNVNAKGSFYFDAKDQSHTVASVDTMSGSIDGSQQNAQKISSLQQELQNRIKQNAGGIAQKIQGEAISSPQNMRFINIRYKIFILIIGCIGAYLFPYVQGAYTKYIQSVQIKNQIAQDIGLTVIKQQSYAKDYQMLRKISDTLASQDSGVLPFVACVNYGRACDEVDPEILENKDLIRLFAQLGDISHPKMDIDEKLVLRNINEFLLQKEPFAQNIVYNGELVSLSIGDPRGEIANLYSAPVRMMVTFGSKEDVLSFLANVEDRIFYHPENGFTGSILYKIEEIQYDIMNYTVEQNVQVDMIMYRYSIQAPLF